MTNYLVISGASSGIGLATAQLFQQQGWKIINLARRPCAVPEAINIPVDLAKLADTEAAALAVKKLIKNPAKIALVHNAASCPQDNALTIDATVLERSLAIGLVAPSQLNKHLTPLMPAGSSIIYIGSTLSEKAVANYATYVTTKHALLGLMRATCQDLINTGIHTCCVCPGFTDTAMLRDNVKHDTAILTAIAARTTLQRLIQPAEIASLIAYCANNPVINGAVLHAHLGQIEA